MNADGVLREDGAHRDARIVAILRQQAAAMSIMLICTCGRAEIDADGICPACEAGLPMMLEMARWEAERKEALTRHELAVRVDCPYCGAESGEVCFTRPAKNSRGILDHKDRYRAACGLLTNAGTHDG